MQKVTLYVPLSSIEKFNYPIGTIFLDEYHPRKQLEVLLKSLVENPNSTVYFVSTNDMTLQHFNNLVSISMFESIANSEQAGYNGLMIPLENISVFLVEEDGSKQKLEWQSNEELLGFYYEWISDLVVSLNEKTFKIYALKKEIED